MSGQQLSIGNELKDSYKETHKWVQNNIKWLKDIETFYRERAKIEREYSEKLSHLTTEHFGKKSNNTVSISVGDTPSTTPGSIEAASVVAWNEILTQSELISKDHGKLSQDFDGQIGSQISGLSTKLEMIVTRLEGYEKEMTDRRNDVYQDLEKAKKNYDASCTTMELARNKNTKSPGQRTQQKLTDREHDMNIAKNEYLIKINQANRVKDKYYFQDLPEVLDLLQDVNEVRTVFMNEIWKEASSNEINLSNQVQKRLETVNSVVSKNLPSLSVAMFIKHNVKQWKEPADFQYKASPVWHDDEKFAVPSQIEANDLRVKLAQSEEDYNRNHDLAQTELAQLSNLNKKKKEMKSNEESMKGREFFDLLKNYILVAFSFTNHETAKLKAEVQIESIQNNTPDEFDLSTENVDVSSSKKKGGIFGKLKSGLLRPESKQSSGNNSRSHLSVFSSLGHSKKLSDTSYSDTGLSINSGDDSQSIFTTGSDAKPSASGNSSSNKVLFAYSKQDDDEISINPGQDISLVTVDSGSGWTKIKNITTGKTGLVPSTYVEIKEKSTGRGSAPVAPPPRRTTMPKRTVEALYDYKSQGNDEISLSKGDIINLIKSDDGSGWTFGEINGFKGLFPSSYCK